MNRADGGGEEVPRFAPRAIRLALNVLLVGFVCHVSTEIGFAHKFPPHYISPLWPTGAILFSVLVVTPVRHWWAYTLAAYFTSVINDVRAGFPISALLFIVAGISEILIAAVGVRRLADGLRAFDSLRSLVVYIVIAVVLAPFASAFVGALAGGAEHYSFYWRVWFLSEALAYLTLAPAILTLIGAARTTLRNASRARCIEACLIGCGLAAISLRVFSWPTAGEGAVPALVYLPLPLLLWAAVRFGPAGVNTSLLIVAFLSISGAVQGRGPFATSSPAENVLALQLFLLVISLPLMFLAALIAEGRAKTNILRESEARFRSMADTAPVLIWMSGPDKLCTFLNQGWLDFTGRPLEQELGNGWAEGVHPDDLDRRMATYVSAFDGRRAFTMEYRLRRHDGEYRWVLDQGVPRLAPDGTFLGYIGCADDISERKRAEEQLRASHERQRDLASRLLRAQEVERRRLAREMHDDLTQRLAVLAIEIGKLEQQPDLPGPLTESLRRTRDQLVKLSEDVHALSRQLHPSILDDLGLVDALRSECVRFQQREGLVVTCQAENVPAGLPRDTALCLYRIAQEALRNVARHAEARRAEVSLTGYDGDVLLTVSDEGKGFDLHGARSRPGLGLASMEERARLIGADLSIQSHPGKGTTISVLVPRRGREP
jgi:PAS domain S-box-containing protein